MERLNIYFMHSNKFDYENLIYKKVLSSSVCLMQNVILPYSDNNKTKYAKDLIKSADLVIVDLYKPSFGLSLELRWLSKIKDKKVLFLSQDNIIPKKYQKIVTDFTKDDENNISLYNDFAYKSIETEQLVDLGIDELKELNNGQVKKVKAKGKLKQRIIVTYSRKMDEYQKKIRNRQIERAKYLLENNSDPESIKRNPNDYRRFIKNDKSSESKYSIDEDKINEESKYDGYYAIATNIFNMSEREIFEINSRRYKIEDCFRIMKTDMSSRPVFVQKDNRIIGHFMICYTALLILRLIEVKINRRKKSSFSIHELIETMKNMNVAEITPFFHSQYTGSNCLDALEAEFNLGLDNVWFPLNSLNKLLKNIKIKKTPYNNI